MLAAPAKKSGEQLYAATFFEFLVGAACTGIISPNFFIIRIAVYRVRRYKLSYAQLALYE